ncbi:hypothetical protein [Paraburkholderia sp. RL17-337-BIB-A]|uniref:hypothetical protein n=1 Tax=Paraburkholderia sp. RL17-337-BIB-A TaxID=3031636 RepID=UPI0038BCD7E1
MAAKKNRKLRIDGLGAPNGVLADALSGTGHRVDKIYEETMEAVSHIVGWRRSTYSKTGLVAEVLHVGNFNVAATEAKRHDLRAELSRYGHPETDIRIRKDGAVVRELQSKYCKDAETTYEACRASRYEHVDKVTPSDQYEAVKRVAEKAGKPTSKARIRKKSRTPRPDEFTDHLEHDGVAGNGVPYDEARRASGGDLSGLTWRRQRADTLHTTKAAMKSAAMLSGGISTLQHAVKVVRREEKVAEAVTNVAVETTASVVTAGITMAAAKTVEHAIVNATGKAATRLVSSGTLTVVQTIFNLVRLFMNGELSAKRAAEEILIAGAGLGGAELGAIIGTALLPGVGTVIGGLVGGIGGQWLLTKLLERARKEQVKEGRLDAPHMQRLEYRPSANDPESLQA